MFMLKLQKKKKNEKHQKNDPTTTPYSTTPYSKNTFIG